MLIVSCHTNHERFHPTDLNKHSLAGRLPAALYWGAGSRSLTGKGVSRMEATRLVETGLPCAWTACVNVASEKQRATGAPW